MEMVNKSKTLGKAELELLQYIDEHHPVTVREVAEYWEKKSGLARTTVLTMMDRLKNKGFLSRKKIDNVFHYSPKASAASVLQNLVQDFVQGVLGGSLAPFAAYLNDAKNLDPAEVEKLKKIVRELDCVPTKEEKSK
jgi:BlaI family transcriptional regulator, penicillinase repressor